VVNMERKRERGGDNRNVKNEDVRIDCDVDLYGV
jgi:hypothetical protein